MSVNKVILIGNLGQDPVVRYMTSGDAVANISLATSKRWKDKDTGEQKENTEWHRVVFFKHLAEIAGQYVKKGSKVYIEGALKTRKWQDNTGTDRYVTEIVASDLQMLDSREPNKNAVSGNVPPDNTSSLDDAGVYDGPQHDYDDDIPF